jgi:type I restriction enzyme S subunit
MGGESSNDWETIPLGELTENLDSIRVPVKGADRKPGPYPYYGASGVVDHVDGFLFEGEHLLIAEDGENLRTRQTPVAFIAKGKFWVNNHAHIVRGNGRATTRFLCYALSQADINGYLSGSTMPKLTQGNMNRIQILTPPRPLQDAIARILGALDDKIELNRRMNETLESMARAIFKSWFVDFDPVRAKMDGQQPAGMNPETAALFPDSFEEQDGEMVPKGWEVGSLSQIADLQTKSVSPGSEPLREWEHYSIPAFDDGKQPARELGSEIKSNKYVVPANCILVSKLNPRFPRIWFPDIDDADASICSTEFMPFVPRKPEWRSFLHETVWSDSFQTEIQSRATGSTGSRQRVKPKEVAELPIVIPSVSATDALAQLTSPLHIRQLANIRASQTLADLRDTLLPKLLSGELRVPEAEKQVEEVA